MNLRNFDPENPAKFVYFSLEYKEFAEKLEKGMQMKGMSIDLNDFSSKVERITGEGNKIESTTSKSREILTGLNNVQLKEELAKQENLFSENARPEDVEDFFKKYLQKNSLENLSDEEWQKVLGNVGSEIKDIYLQASQEYQKNKISPEKANEELKKLFKNGQELERNIYLKGLRKPDEILEYVRKNTDQLSEEIREVFEIDNPELDSFIKNEAALDLAAKFEKREEVAEKKEASAQKLIEDFPGKIIGTNDWAKLDNDQLNKLFAEEFKSLNLNKMPEYVATKLRGRLMKNLANSLRLSKEKIYEAQVNQKKLGTAEKIIDWVFENNENLAGKSEKEIDQEIYNVLDIKRLNKNLPDKYQKLLTEKVEELKNKKVEEFLKTNKDKTEEKEEDQDKISRHKMKESWDSWVTHLSDFSKDFKNSRDFQKSFIKKYFANNSKDAESYFEKHPNFSKAFDKEFTKYEKGQDADFNKKIKTVFAKLSDSRVANSMRTSFKNAQNNKQKREWLDYLNKNITGYEKSIQNSAKLESRLTTGFKTLKAHPKIAKIREKFSLTKKSRQFLNNKNQYISPRDYESDLKKLDKEFSAIEKKDKIDRTLAEKNIAKLSVKDFNLKNSRIKNRTDFAKSGKIKMPEYLWQEFGKDSYKAKIRELYPKYLEAKEGGLEKSPSVKFAKETIKKLNHENLDFSRDFATQQSFNRQRHLRNNVSFTPEVWEIVKDDFFQKSEILYKEHQEIRKEMTTLSKSIKGLKPANLDFDKDYKNLREFSHQPKFFEFFKNQKVSNRAYDKVKNSEFIPKVLELYGDYLKQKESPENSPETKKEREIIENIELKDLDISQDFANFTEFKRQPFLRKTVSFDPDIWKKVQPNFEQKALQLYADQIKVREEQKKFEKSLSSLTTEDLETNFEDFAGFVHQPAMQKFFTELNISDMAYDNLTDDFAAKMDELWESVKDSKDKAEFGDKDMQKLGTKHGLDFFNLPLDSRENLSLKFERLDKLLTHNSSLASFFRRQEKHLTPVFLSFLGEMNNEDFKRLDDELGTSEKSPDEIVNIFFGNSRRKYLLSEVRKNDSDAWRRLEIAERSFSGDLDIRGIILGNKELELEDEEFAKFELDEDGNPILETELLDDSLEGSLDSDESISEKNETGEIVDEEITLEDESEEEENEVESRGILDEDIETEDEEKEDSLDDNEEEVIEIEEIDEDAEENEISRDSNDVETRNLSSSEKSSDDVGTEDLQSDGEQISPAPFVKGDPEIKEGNPILETEEDDSEEDEELDEEKSSEILDEEVEIEDEEEKLDSTEKIAEADEADELTDEEINLDEGKEDFLDDNEEEVIEIEEIDADEEENEISRDSDDVETKDLSSSEKSSDDVEAEDLQPAGEQIPPAPFFKGEPEIKEDSEEEKIKLEKEDIEKEELKSREKILENIQREELEESEQEKEERIENEQKELRRILRQDEFFQKLEKEGIDEIAEDGDEDSLRGNVRDDLLQQKSPVNFAEIHCSKTMSLESLLSKVHTYLELIAEKDINFQINLSEKEQKREVHNSREMFLIITDFLLQKEVSFLQKVLFRGMNFAENKCSLRINAQYLNDSVSKKFEFHLLERV